MEQVLENGPWLIRLIPIILNIWMPNAMLKKDEVKTALVWVKMHNVPIVAYSKIGLSLIYMKLGCPIMLDAYTSNMCVKYWGCNTYTRELIEVSAKTALLDSLNVTIPFPNGTGHTMEKIDVAYEWQPPRCGLCKIFDHNDECCPKVVRATESTKAYDDRFVEVTRKKGTLTDELASSILDSNYEEVEEVFAEKDLSIEPMDGVFDD
ncbi:zinc knuckle CX2CX4HX4C containing protein [Tanacetum coccineum]|uniref:Zinc knuckle CX2CX4HX4C containing protein n=1 Tax=Tanacetum coccineum TaxID=301880 RepID=A0ABQ5C7U9_9ASTR